VLSVRLLPLIAHQSIPDNGSHVPIHSSFTSSSAIYTAILTVAAFISTFIVGVSLHYKQLVSTDTPSAPPNGSPAFVINAHLTVDENLFKEKGRDIKLEKYEKQIFAVFAFAVRASLPNSPISAVGFHRLRRSEFPRNFSPISILGPRSARPEY
jgi:hypothetical protein